MLRHCAPYLPNGKAYELQSWFTDGGRRSASATGAMTSKVKGQGRKVSDQSEPSWPNAIPVLLEAGGGIPCRSNPAATLLVECGTEWQLELLRKTALTTRMLQEFVPCYFL